MVVDFSQRRVVRQLGNLRIDQDSYRVAVEGQMVSLGLHEFDLLELLAREPNRIISSEQIELSLWEASGPKYARRLSVLVYRLRAKLNLMDEYKLLSVRGRGYGLLSTAAWADEDATAG